MALQETITRPSEVAHVLSVDIYDYAKFSESERIRFVAELSRAVRDCPTYRSLLDAESVLVMPSTEGLVLVFSGDLSAPAQCAIELAGIVRNLAFGVRMGIHSGHVEWLVDAPGQPKVAGKGINLAIRVMEFANEGQILLSRQYANWLAQYDGWRKHIQPMGEAVAAHGVRISLANLSSESFGDPATPVSMSEDTDEHTRRLSIVLLYRRMAEPDNFVVFLLEKQLKALGHDLFIDRDINVGVEWAKEIERRIREADVVISVVSDASSGSEMLEYEVEVALHEYRQRGRPLVLPVRVGGDGPLMGVLGDMLNPLQFITWSGEHDNEKVMKALTDSFEQPEWKIQKEPMLEAVGGAIPVDSTMYVVRESDGICLEAIKTNHSIVLIKGSRQIGKTSLLARGAALVDSLGWHQVVTDFQKVNSSHLGSEETFYRMLAAVIANQLNFDYNWEKKWVDAFGPNMNMDIFLREALSATDKPVVWFMDEADRIFALPFASDFFGLVRSWHNSRAIEPRGPWNKFTLVISYATEAHLFIRDLNQSPFNVGLQIPLQFFTVEQTADLNERHGSPLKSGEEVRQLQELVGGQPFLTRRALDLLARQRIDFPTLLATADKDDGPFGDHLKRILISVCHIPSVEAALRDVFTQPDLRNGAAFQKLVTAGVLVVDSQNKVMYRTDLYRRFIERHQAALR